ncbi:BppU family phage baseplate upper protein [Bacillus safensis]|uniref:BppU family phage baseplate upper protein n=1 Tax=Bacillus safensis TaxID=561879 RepID=UPI002282F08C|nr:BppU family phage baseplate upper protein [Bacillus safensis]MCY7430528.1 BppU family phage baseplate upper protein [Bacillus safensis]
MIRKNGSLEFDVNAYTNSSVSTSINFWTQDRQTARLTFKLTKDGVPLPLAAVTGKLVLVMADGSRFIRDVTIVDRVNGHAEYVLTDEEIKHHGNVQAELNLYYANDQSMSVHQFSFNISKSLIDQDIVPITEYYVDEFEALRTKINALYDESIKSIADLRAKFEDLEKIETKQGAQDKVDAHANNSEIHVVKADKDKWNNGQLYRLTQNNGKPIYKGTSETTDYNEITDTGFYLIYNKGLNGPPTVNKSFMIVLSYGSTLLQTAYNTNGKKSFYRVRNQDSTWTVWMSSLTEEDKISQSEKDKWNNGQLSKITADNGMPLISIKDTSLSILDEVINNGLGQGTFYAIAGSKDLPNHRSFRGFFHMTDTTNGKASFGWVYATDYANNIYTNYLNNNVWTGWSRISNHNMLSEDGKSQLLPNGTDILTLPSGYYYAVGTNVVNMPSKTDSSWFNIYVLDNGNNRKTFHVIRSADNLHWWGTVHTDGTFKGWDRMLTEKDLSSTWNQVTFVTGTTKHFASNPLLFSIRLNSLHLRGSFEGIPANDTVIARFAQKPSGETAFLGATVGSYGSARLTLEKDGSLKFNGLNANDNSKVSRVEINESIPLW